MAYNLDMDVIDDERHIIVYDLGNTFDLSLLSIDSGLLKFIPPLVILT